MDGPPKLNVSPDKGEELDQIAEGADADEE